jgi:hypothetical protein
MIIGPYTAALSCGSAALEDDGKEDFIWKNCLIANRLAVMEDCKQYHGVTCTLSMNRLVRWWYPPLVSHLTTQYALEFSLRT